MLGRFDFRGRLSRASWIAFSASFCDVDPPARLLLVKEDGHHPSRLNIRNLGRLTAYDVAGER
jgi:hypothetical protein